MPLTQITSGGIQDGTITNDDISASATIDATKITGLDKISEGNTEAEVVDTGSNGHFKVTTEGTERLRVDSSGRCGIGTSSPGHTLDVSGAFRSTGIARLGTGQTTTLAYIGNPDTAGNKYIQFGRASALTDIVNIQGIDAGVGSANISLQASGGNVGIGTTDNEGFKFKVTESGGNLARFTNGATQTMDVVLDSSGFTLQNPNNGYIAFKGSSTERARIDSSGRWLLGTSSSSADATLVLMKHSGDANGPGILHLSNPNSAPGSGAGLGLIRFSNSTQNTFASIEAYADAASGSNDYPGRLVFSTTADSASSPTERMRITSVGCVGIGATPGANNERLKVYRSDSNLRVVDFENGRNVSGDELVRLNLGSNCNNTSSFHLIATTGGTDRYYLYGNGTYATSSDQRLKKNIETTRDGYLEDLCNLRVVKYNWNEQDDGDPKELGLIAQELEQVFPGLVQEGPANEEGQTYKAIKSSVLPFMLLKALQESTARIEALEVEVAALKAQ